MSLNALLAMLNARRSLRTNAISSAAVSIPLSRIHPGDTTDTSHPSDFTDVSRHLRCRIRTLQQVLSEQRRTSLQEDRDDGQSGCHGCRTCKLTRSTALLQCEYPSACSNRTTSCRQRSLLVANISLDDATMNYKQHERQVLCGSNSTSR